MYERPKSKKHEQAWLEAERNLLARGCKVSLYPQNEQEIPLSEKNPFDSHPISGKDRGEFTKDEFMKALEKTTRPLDEGKF